MLQNFGAKTKTVMFLYLLIGLGYSSGIFVLIGRAPRREFKLNQPSVNISK